MQFATFVIGDEPYCLWEQDVVARTRDFLSGLDPDFFTYVLNSHMNTDDERRASVAIRMAFHHATETLFSLLGALVQAHDCPYAWIARCSNADLREVVARITMRDPSLVLSWKAPSPLGWDEVASIVFDTFHPGTDLQRRTIDGFSKLWRGLADELLNEHVIDEYNATKHGFRARPGGFKLEFAPIKTPDLLPTDDEMTVLGQSEFGAMFYKVEKIDEKGGKHLRSKQVAMNWSLHRDTLLLQLAQFSINNVVSRLPMAWYRVNASFFVRPATKTFHAHGGTTRASSTWSLTLA